VKKPILAFLFVALVACGSASKTPERPDFRCLNSGTFCPNEPKFDCQPTTALFGACDGVPSMFGYDAPSSLRSMRFPVGCVVRLPVKNPYYGDLQGCACERGSWFHANKWACPV
jgi:hypothetical protein